MAEPKKPLFYRMGQVCELVGLESHVLRFWENEFSQLNPRKNRSGHRVFTADDVALIRRIKQLLHEEGFTIAGAQRRLKEESTDSSEEVSVDPSSWQSEVRSIRVELENLLKRLDGTGAFQ